MKKQARRDSIIKAAVQVFINKGYQGATTSDIAREAQISEVTLFRYFDTKRQLFEVAIQPLIVSSLEQTMSQTADFNPHKKLKHLISERIELISLHKDVIKLVLMEEQINSEITEFDFIGKIKGLMTQALHDSGIRISNEEISLRLILGGLISFLYIPSQSQKEIDSFVEQLVDTILALGER